MAATSTMRHNLSGNLLRGSAGGFRGPGIYANARCEENVLLLDRKKIRRWAKWVALILAIVFGLSFLTMGVGYGTGSFNIFATIFGGDNTDTTEPQTLEEKLAAALEALEANDKDTTTMLEAATLFERRYEETRDAVDLESAAALMESAIEVDPTLKDVYIRLANLYLSQEYNNSAAAVAVLNKAASVDPTNPDVFLKLGIAQNSLGNTAAAVMAWEKYLELDPDGDMADVVQDQVEKLTATTTTTAGAGSTTTSGSTATSGSTTTSTTD